MTDFGQPTRKDHQNFCLNEGWTQVRNARGKGGHHVTFELTFPTARYSAPESRTHRTGSDLRSEPRGRTSCAISWTSARTEFSACVRERKLPQRGPQRADHALHPRRSRGPAAVARVEGESVKCG